LEMVADVNPAWAEAAARNLGFARWSADWREVVADPRVDVVDNTAPNDVHHDIALAALAAGVVVLAGRVAAAPEIERATLEAHDAVVRRLAALAGALLPVRFGTMVASERALAEAVAVQARPLAAALELVAGREQMTLRLYGPPAAATTAGAAEPDASELAPGPGARYLTARLRDHRRAQAPPALGPLRAALAPLVHGERIERHATPPLIASVYHLVARGSAADYRAALEAALPALEPLRAAASGPWPPYAFAPGLDPITGVVA
ncbi:MAG: GvpL/GvpF family gas vesicle protein, partial [Burkholderiales bacterium]